MEKKIYSLIATIQQKNKQYRFKCFIPGCKKYAIRSHSQSRANSLNNICENGYVITTLSSFWSFIRNCDPAKYFEKIGVKKASTFQGFCQQHDNEYFKQADTINLNMLNKEALSKLAFRSFAYEVRTKQRVLYSTQLMEHYGKGLIDTDFFKIYTMGISTFLRITFPFYMERWLSVLKNKKYDEIKHIVFTFNKNIGLSCSSMIDLSPSINNVEKELRNFHIPRPVAFFNVIPKQSSTIVVFSCFLDEEQRVKKFIDNYKLLAQIVYNYCEEVLFNPSLFDSFSTNMKRKIINGLRGWAFWKEVDFSTLHSTLVLTSPQYI